MLLPPHRSPHSKNMAAALLNLQRIARTFTPLSALTRSYYVRPVVPSTLDPATHRIGFGPHSVPAPPIKQPADFLKRIGRGAETKLSAESWDALWRMDGVAMKKAGVGVRDRRCVRCPVAGASLGPSVVPADPLERRRALHSALLMAGGCAGTFNGAWRSSASASRLRSSRTSRHRRRPLEGALRALFFCCAVADASGTPQMGAQGPEREADTLTPGQGQEEEGKDGQSVATYITRLISIVFSLHNHIHWHELATSRCANRNKLGIGNN